MDEKSEHTRATADSVHEDDPATRLLRRGGLVLLLGGLLIFTIPRAVVGLVSGDAERVIGAAIALAFWAWLTWRLAVLMRTPGASQDPGYYFTSAVGYAGFSVVYAGVAVWRASNDDFEPRTLPFMVILIGLALFSWWAGRKAAAARAGAGLST